MRPTIKQVAEKMGSVVGKKFVCPITKNKGAVGHLLEEKLGIPKSSACLDCEDGELKTFPLKRLKTGTLVPKETVAVTMLSEEALRSSEFCDSKCFRKMEKMLMIPYLRDKDTVTFFEPTLINLNGELLETLKADYDLIRNTFVETGVMQSKNGKYLQSRTKGPGGVVKTRAFYLRPVFMKKFVTF